MGSLSHGSWSRGGLAATQRCHGKRVRGEILCLLPSCHHPIFPIMTYWPDLLRSPGEREPEKCSFLDTGTEQSTSMIESRCESRQAGCLHSIFYFLVASFFICPTWGMCHVNQKYSQPSQQRETQSPISCHYPFQAHNFQLIWSFPKVWI